MLTEKQGSDNIGLTALALEADRVGDGLLQNRHRMGRVEPGGDGVIHQRQQRLAGSEPPRSPGGLRLIPGHDDQSHGQRLDAGLPAKRLNRCLAARLPVRPANGQRDRIGVNVTVFIQNSVLIGVVGGPGRNQGLNQRRFAAHTAARNENGLPLPTDDTGVNKEAVRRPKGGQQFGVFFEGC